MVFPFQIEYLGRISHKLGRKTMLLLVYRNLLLNYCVVFFASIALNIIVHLQAKDTSGSILGDGITVGQVLR